MIRGNWSLSAEIRKNERKQQQKVQQRQKRNHKLEKLAHIDPIKLYYKIKRLESNATQQDEKYLKSLQQDWDFIQKNKLHADKLGPFLEKLEKESKQKRLQETKLWGKSSIYFNPELNPLGKVPKNFANYSLVKPLPNLTIPLKHKEHMISHIESTYGIGDLDVILPEGPQPQFYKQVFNTEVQEPKEHNVSKEQNIDTEIDKDNFQDSLQDDSSDGDGDDSDSQDELRKKRRIHDF